MPPFHNAGQQGARLPGGRRYWGNAALAMPVIALNTKDMTTGVHLRPPQTNHNQAILNTGRTESNLTPPRSVKTKAIYPCINGKQGKSGGFSRNL
jgi:hypothetical protein